MPETRHPKDILKVQIKHKQKNPQGSAKPVPQVLEYNKLNKLYYPIQLYSLGKTPTCNQILKAFNTVENLLTATDHPELTHSCYEDDTHLVAKPTWENKKHQQFQSVTKKTSLHLLQVQSSTMSNIKQNTTCILEDEL